MFDGNKEDRSEYINASLHHTIQWYGHNKSIRCVSSVRHGSPIRQNIRRRNCPLLTLFGLHTSTRAKEALTL